MPEQEADNGIIFKLLAGHGFEVARVVFQLGATIALGLLTYIFLSTVSRIETTADRNEIRVRNLEIENTKLREAILAIADRVTRNETENRRQWDAIMPYAPRRNYDSNK